MQIFHTIEGLREQLAEARKQGKRIGFVPTMGNLHDAHIQLIKTAQTTNDIVVCSIFVNALQFGLNEDWDKYPRTFDNDCNKLRDAGCDFLFHPEDITMYPNGLEHQTRVTCSAMSDVLCGASRPGHFEGVTTVVTKMFNIVQPDEAIFGKKDFQQLAIIRRMCEDLCIPVKITAAPIHREEDGLAMSSRNSYITEEERPKVDQLYKSLSWIEQQINNGNTDFVELEQQAEQQIVEAGFKIDYIVVSNSKTLQPAAADDKDLTILGAMYTSNARLIDNITLQVQK